MTRRVTIDLATGTTLQDTDGFADSKDRCAMVRPDGKGSGQKFDLRTDFYFAGTKANVPASAQPTLPPVTDVPVHSDVCGAGESVWPSFVEA